MLTAQNQVVLATTWVGHKKTWFLYTIKDDMLHFPMCTHQRRSRAAQLQTKRRRNQQLPSFLPFGWSLLLGGSASLLGPCGMVLIVPMLLWVVVLPSCSSFGWSFPPKIILETANRERMDIFFMHTHRRGRHHNPKRKEGGKHHHPPERRRGTAAQLQTRKRRRKQQLRSRSLLDWCCALPSKVFFFMAVLDGKNTIQKREKKDHRQEGEEGSTTQQRGKTHHHPQGKRVESTNTRQEEEEGSTTPNKCRVALDGLGQRHGCWSPHRTSIFVSKHEQLFVFSSVFLSIFTMIVFFEIGSLAD